MRTVGAELRVAMDRRKMGSAALGRALGVSPRQVSGWLRGPGLPRHATVVRMADILQWERLVSASLAARVRDCATCGAVILPAADLHGQRRYCSPGCQRTGHARRTTEGRIENVGTYRRRLGEASRAIAAFCRRCSDGYCPDKRCELNPVSPYIMPGYRRTRKAAAP